MKYQRYNIYFIIILDNEFQSNTTKETWTVKPKSKQKNISSTTKFMLPSEKKKILPLIFDSINQKNQAKNQMNKTRPTSLFDVMLKFLRGCGILKKKTFCQCKIAFLPNQHKPSSDSDFFPVDLDGQEGKNYDFSLPLAGNVCC